MPAAFVQSKSATTGTATSTTISATFGVAVSSGNLVCGGVVWDSNNTATLTSVTDNKSNTYTIQRRLVLSADFESMASFFLPNVTNAPVTVTANFSSALDFRAITIHEASGLRTSAPLDVETGQTQVTPGTGANAVTSGAVTTTVDGDYIFGVTCDANMQRALPEYTAGTGYTKREESGSTTTQNICSEDQVQSTAGSISATFTQANNDDDVTMILTFRVPAAAASVVSPRSLALLGVGS